MVANFSSILCCCCTEPCTRATAPHPPGCIVQAQTPCLVFLDAVAEAHFRPRLPGIIEQPTNQPTPPLSPQAASSKLRPLAKSSWTLWQRLTTRRSNSSGITNGTLTAGGGADGDAPAHAPPPGGKLHMLLDFENLVLDTP